MAEPIISIIIPSYNRTSSIKQTIDSIISQKCNYIFEIIIGDDASTDGVQEVLKEYQLRFPKIIKLILHPKNIGLAANWAYCVKEAVGKYIANCDNDDYWHNKHKLQIQVDFMEANPQYGMSHTDYRLHNRSIEKVENVTINHLKYDDLQKSIFTGSFRCCNATVMYRTSTLKKYLRLDDYIAYQFTLQDWNTWAVLAAYTDFYCIPVSTATFGVETDSITRPSEYSVFKNRLKKEKECYKYICDLFPDKFPYNEQDYDEYINLLLMNFGFEKNNYEVASLYGKKILNKSLKVHLTSNKYLFYLFCTIKNMYTRCSSIS